MMNIIEIKRKTLQELQDLVAQGGLDPLDLILIQREIERKLRGNAQ